MPNPTVNDVHLGGSSPKAAVKPMPALDDKQLIAVLRRLLAQLSLPSEKDSDAEYEDEATEKAYPNTHSARQLDPDTYKVVGSKEIALGVRMLFALKDGKSVAQSIHFDAAKFTAAQARAWLKAHDYSVAQFTAAGGDASAEKGEEDIEFTAEIVAKADDRHLAYAVVYTPGVVDTQQDFILSTQVEAMAHRWLLKSRRYDFQHKSELPSDAAVPVESYIAPTDFTLGSKLVKQGSWVVVSYIPDDELWSLVKNGTINAYSIRGRGKRHPKPLPTAQSV